MINKIVYIICLIGLISWANAQTNKVGINTETPQADLHTNGSLQITKELKVGGTSSTEGDYGQDGQLLVSNGDGNAPQWKTMAEISELPVISVISLNNNSTNRIGANVITKASFSSTPKINSDLITFNPATNEFEVQKSGYYKLSAVLMYDMSENGDNQTKGAARTTILKNSSTVITANYTTHGERTNDVIHNLTGTAYFETGDKISLHGMYTQRYRLSRANMAITYLSE